MKRFVLGLSALALAAAACGGSTDGAGTGAASQDPQDLGTKPTVTVPAGDPPTTLVITDLALGDGAEAVAGTKVSVHYVGVAFSTGQQFDASWDRGQPFGFTLGNREVITGWDQGVAGMKVGGRRELIIPADLAYGERGAGGVIGPGETLIFVVDLLAVS